MAIETFLPSISEESVSTFEARIAPDGRFGADVRFLGVVRALEDGREILGIHYTCYWEMAERELDRIGQALHDEEPGHRALVHHRTGFVPQGEASIVIRIQTLHSAAGFALCQEYLRRIKTTVPIWKEPVWR